MATGKKVTVSGQLTNKEPGYPALKNEPVSVDQLVGTVPVKIAQGTTNCDRRLQHLVHAGIERLYQVSTGQISKVEDTSLSPAYGDILSPAVKHRLAGVGDGHRLDHEHDDVRRCGAGVWKTSRRRHPTANGTVTLLAKQPGKSSYSVSRLRELQGQGAEELRRLGHR